MVQKIIVRSVEYVELDDFILCRKVETPEEVCPCPQAAFRAILSDYITSGGWFPEWPANGHLGTYILFKLVEEARGHIKIATGIATADGSPLNLNDLQSAEGKAQAVSLGMPEETYDRWLSAELSRLNPTGVAQ